MADSIYSQEWLRSTIQSEPVYCESYTDGKNVSDEDAAIGTEVSIEGVNLYGLKLVYYVVDEDIVRDPLFGEDQLDKISRAFFFMGYLTQLAPNVRTYQLQGIFGEDVVQLYVTNGSFKYFSTYGGSDRNTPNLHDKMSPRIGDIIYIPNNNTFYEIFDVKYWEESFGLTSRYTQITMRVYKDTKRTVLLDDTIPKDDPIRYQSPSEIEADHPTPDILRLNPDETLNPDHPDIIPDDGSVDLFDWEFDFNKSEK